jgi:hypothetical protein
MNLALELLIMFLLTKWLGWDLVGWDWWLFVILTVLCHEELSKLKIKVVE